MKNKLRARCSQRLGRSPYSLLISEQGSQPPLPVKGGEIIKAPDVSLTDIDLRYGASACTAHHLIAGLWIEVDTNFFDGLDPPLAKKGLGPLAVGADSGGIHKHGSHRGFLCINKCQENMGLEPKGLAIKDAEGLGVGTASLLGDRKACLLPGIKAAFKAIDICHPGFAKFSARLSRPKAACAHKDDRARLLA
jgi:hypothetical protein